MHMGDIAHNPMTLAARRVDARVRPRAQAINSRKASLTGSRPTGSWRWAIIFRPRRSDMSSDTTRQYRWDNVLWRNAMSSTEERFRIAVLDDYQDVALSLADWSAL